MKKTLLRKKDLFFVVVYLSDVSMFALSMMLSFLFFYGFDKSTFALMVPSIRFFLFTIFILLINNTHYELYKDKRNFFDSNEFMNIVYSLLLTYFITIFFVMLFNYDVILIILITFSIVLTIFFSALARHLLYQLVYFFRLLGYDIKKVVFYGQKNDDLIERIKENKFLGYDLVKSTDNFNELIKFLKKADIVFITKEKIDEKLLDLIIQNDSINWKIIPSALNLVIDPVRFDEFKDYPIINVSRSQIHTVYMFVKRTMDFLISGLALAVLSPLFLTVALIIKVTMPGPVFFRQERLGRDLKPFMVFKFRSMIIHADDQKSRLKSEVKGLFKMKKDPRITPFGMFLRRTCIDELPQLINIFLGDMSVVGPRPHLRQELGYFKGWRMTRFKVKPGLTGMWQVNGRHELNFDKAVLYDIYYVKHMSLLLDIRIILKTIPSILMSRGKH